MNTSSESAESAGCGALASAPEAASDPVLDALLARMRGKSDFPALSESVCRIQSMVNSEHESIGSVTNEILKDVALTNKLLRLVNSAHYARDGSVGTVSRAVSLVGFNGIRNMALSLVLLDHMQDKANANLLKEEFLRALMAGAIAAEMSATQADSEAAFLGAMFQNLGRMLAQLYFPQEAANIRASITAAHDARSEALASQRELGLSYEALGVGIAKAWGLPDCIQRCIVQPKGEPPSQPPKEPQSALHWRVSAANAMADAMLHADAAVVDVRLNQLGKRYGKALGLSGEQLAAVSARARDKLADLAQAMEISVPTDSLVWHLLKPTSQAQSPSAVQPQEASDTLTSMALCATASDATAAGVAAIQPNETPDASSNAASGERVAQMLTAGIQDITNAMVEDFRLSDVLRMILESMFRALDFQRVVFCLREPKTDILAGRFGLGKGVEDVVKHFRVPLQTSGTADLFATICSKGADTLIRDSSDPRIAARLPVWYLRDYHAPTFLILPLSLKGRPFGLIYADRATPGSLAVSEQELSLLRTLRNQAVMAFKQSS